MKIRKHLEWCRHFVDLENVGKWRLDCKRRRWYSRKRASETIYELCQSHFVYVLNPVGNMRNGPSGPSVLASGTSIFFSIEAELSAGWFAGWPRGFFFWRELVATEARSIVATTTAGRRQHTIFGSQLQPYQSMQEVVLEDLSDSSMSFSAASRSVEAIAVHEACQRSMGILREVTHFHFYLFIHSFCLLWVASYLEKYAHGIS